MKLLVTGGAGFVGSHFVRTVLTDAMPGLEGARVTVLDKLSHTGNFNNLGPVAENKRLDFIPGDIGDAALVDFAVRDADAILHAAESSSATDVVGTQILLDAALRHGTARFLLVSTHEVYGSIDTGAWTERSPVAPDTPYGATKAAGDLLARAFHRTHGLPVVITRGAATYGPYQHPENLVPRIAVSLLAGRPVDLPGEAVRDWVHVDDHCRGLALALTEGVAGEVYTIGGGAELSDSALVSLCGAQLGTVHGGSHTRHVLDDDRIRRELGYRPRITVEDGLAATVAWYRDHEEWWRPLLAG
jgi:dTDP-glucose 4,6-dehydratase